MSCPLPSWPWLLRSRSVPRVLLVLCLAASASAFAQQPEEARPASTPAQEPSSQVPGQEAPSPPSVDRLALPPKARAFEFTKADLTLLLQVDAFDKYMEEKGWVYDDPDTNAYLDRLGRSLVPEETPDNVRWRFRAVRDLDVNAFALPNGSIYVNSGLLSRMENEAQLAGVLAHEIAHVTNRHGYLENRSYRKKMVILNVIAAAAAGAYYAGVNPDIVCAMGTLLPVIVVSTVYGYSRELEREADVYAVNAAHLRRYDLREFSRGFQLLRTGPEVDLSKEPVFWASHPKLAERVQYVAAEAARLQPSADGWRVEQASYRADTRKVVRHNAGLAILLGRPRTAVAIAQRLIADEPGSAENFVLLGDAYRSLGARTPVPDADELTDNSRDDARKRMRTMTLVEYDRALLADPHGTERWDANAARSEEAFHRALEMDPGNATAHRGLGFLFERKQRRAEALEQFRKYLELSPEARDARQIRGHIESLEKNAPAEGPAPDTPAKGAAGGRP
jgi:tetratricopeptide (TPR) repeat protein